MDLTILSHSALWGYSIRVAGVRRQRSFKICFRIVTCRNDVLASLRLLPLLSVQHLGITLEIVTQTGDTTCFYPPVGKG